MYINYINILVFCVINADLSDVSKMSSSINLDHSYIKKSPGFKSIFFKIRVSNAAGLLNSFAFSIFEI